VCVCLRVHACMYVYTRICVCTYMHMHISMQRVCTLNVQYIALFKIHDQLAETYQYMRPQWRNGWVTWPMQLRALHLSYACREPPTQKCHHQRWNDSSLFIIYSPEHSTPLKIVSLTSALFQCPGLISSLQIAHAQSTWPDADSNSCFYQHSVNPK